LKFNSPILPFAKFPLTQNKYIQDFLKRYEEDSEQIDRVIGVHFLGNNNLNASSSIGIEIEIQRKNNLPVVESVSEKRFQVLDYDELTNFCTAVEFKDTPTEPEQDSDKAKARFDDLLMSEMHELKNLWFIYNKKINSMVAILPQEMLNRVRTFSN